MGLFADIPVIIKGAGDLATGVATRLWRSGFKVALTELAQPLAIRRTVSFAEAIYDGKTTVEGLEACRVRDEAGVQAAWHKQVIPVMVDPDGRSIAELRPKVVVDAILAKRNLGTRIGDALLVVGLGPGFTAGRDAHAVVETHRGHYLGRVLWTGSAQPDTGLPGRVQGIGRERVIYAPAGGLFLHGKSIGTAVEAGELVGWVSSTPVVAPISGVLRGLIHDGVCIHLDMKIGDVDPRGIPEYCWKISDKALAVAGGVQEAILVHLGRPPDQRREP